MNRECRSCSFFRCIHKAELLHVKSLKSMPGEAENYTDILISKTFQYTVNLPVVSVDNWYHCMCYDLVLTLKYILSLISSYMVVSREVEMKLLWHLIFVVNVCTAEGPKQLGLVSVALLAENYHNHLFNSANEVYSLTHTSFNKTSSVIY